jgi:hypothetical protein
MRTEHARDHRRHALLASCIVRASSDGRLLGDRTLDVSYSGIRVSALDHARVGERVDVSLEVPGSRVWIRAQGRIERVVEGRRAGDGGRSLGVRVDRMDGFSRVLLTSIARQFPEVSSSRGASRGYAEAVARIDGENA